MMPFMAEVDAASAMTAVTDPGFWLRLLDYVKTEGPSFGLQVLGAVAILFLGRFFAGATRKGLTKMMSARGADPSLTGFISSLVYFGIMAVTVIATVDQFGVETASFVAIFGAAGFAVGMALQGTLANFASGVMIMVFRPFVTGDVVEAAGVKGKIEDISIFNTSLKTPDNVLIIVPNGQLYGGIIKNYSSCATRRVDMVMGVGYGADLDQALALLREMCDRDERILRDPAATIAVAALADSAVNIAVRPWVKSADYWGVYHDMQKNVKQEFDRAGIDIPYPQSVVHLKKIEN